MTRDLFDLGKFLESLANDEELGRELVEAFMEDAPRRTANLAEALEDGGDSASAAKLAHSLKGMCGVVRADALSSLALEMEILSRQGKLDAVRVRFETFKESLAGTMEQMNRFMQNSAG